MSKPVCLQDHTAETLELAGSETLAAGQAARQADSQHWLGKTTRESGWPGRTRTSTTGSKGTCPTIRRPAIDCFRQLSTPPPPLAVRSVDALLVAFGASGQAAEQNLLADLQTGSDEGLGVAEILHAHIAPQKLTFAVDINESRVFSV